MTKAARESYTGIAMLLHWLIAAAVLGMFAAPDFFWVLKL